MNGKKSVSLTSEAVDHTYCERNKVIIVGLTGRTGSGCTTLSQILSNPDFKSLCYHTCNSYNYNNIEERKRYMVHKY